MAEASSRREFLRRARDGGVLLLTFTVAGCEKELSPEQAREEGVPYTQLSELEALNLDALGEALVPGASAAGLSHYVDQQLGAPIEKQMLMLKYLGLPPPHDDFYHQGLAALEALSQAQHGNAFHSLTAEQATAVVGAVASGNADGWEGPPPPLFYFALRSDAVDVVYGTPNGFEQLGIPYQAHIMPPEGWG